MRLSQLLRDVPAKVPDVDPEIHAVRDDSRAVGKGDLFVCVRGRTVDGHDFARGAVDQGAAALVVERPVDLGHLGAAESVPQVVVPDASRALAWIAANESGRPADAMTMIGVTGTNGKTTTTYVLESVLAAAGHKSGVIGTVSYRYGGHELPAPFTTPTALQLHPVFRAMRESGCDHAVMEVTSSALAMDRVEAIFFDVGVFTNLTQDHLDVHGSMDAYFEAKARLFAERLRPGAAAVAMIDDPRGDEILARAPSRSRRLRVSVERKDADVFPLAFTSDIRGIRATLQTPRGRLEVASAALLGSYNLANLATAVAVGEALGLPQEAIARGIAGLPGVPGRVERVANARGLDVFVDYAHTPDALERVIAALRPVTRGKLIAVFGCGGDRDRTKRPQMGRIAARDADLAVVTSDNPRTEEPMAIIDKILEGVREVGRPHLVDPDRRKAIAAAVQAARPGDVVLIAGKGHEDYQILGKTKIHFDDREEAAAAIAALPEG